MEIILIGFVILLTLYSVGSTIALIRNYSKVNTYESEMEKLANKSQEIISQYEKWILHYKSVVNEAYNTMQETDLRGSFEADDEVGNAFKAIKDVVDALQKFTTETITEENINKKTTTEGL